MTLPLGDDFKWDHSALSLLHPLAAMLLDRSVLRILWAACREMGDGKRTQVKPARSVRDGCCRGEAACLIPPRNSHMPRLTLGMQERKGLTSMLVSMTLS